MVCWWRSILNSWSTHPSLIESSCYAFYRTWNECILNGKIPSGDFSVSTNCDLSFSYLVLHWEVHSSMSCTLLDVSPASLMLSASFNVNPLISYPAICSTLCIIVYLRFCDQVSFKRYNTIGQSLQFSRVVFLVGLRTCVYIMCSFVESIPKLWRLAIDLVGGVDQGLWNMLVSFKPFLRSNTLSWCFRYDQLWVCSFIILLCTWNVFMGLLSPQK